MSVSKLCIIFFLLAGSIIAVAQNDYDFDNFTGIQSEGAVPDDLRKPLAQLYAEDKQRVRDYNDGALSNRDRVLSVSYNISRLMSNGRILYGDPISRMVERVADTLLVDYPELRQQLRFYTVKSPAVNAFATGQGMIFVTTGFISQLADEAQLAYVISHEIVHYYRNHNMELISRRDKKTADEEQQIADFLKYHCRSREMESEADSLGLTMFYINSPYDKNVVDGVFDVLQYAEMPYEEIPFDTNYFNTPYYRVRSECWLDEVAEITSRDDYDDSLSTHPNIKKRRTATQRILAPYSGGERFVMTTQEHFAQIRTLARFEGVRQNLVYADFVRAYYDSYVMDMHYPDNRFLARAKAYAIYALAMYRTYQETTAIVGDFAKVEGEMQQLYHLFTKLSARETSLLAMRELWTLHQRFPDDPYVKVWCVDVMNVIRDKHQLNTAFFLNHTANNDTVKVEMSTNDKYARIRQRQQQQRETDMSKYAFSDFIMHNGNFIEFMSQCVSDTGATDKVDLRQGAAYLYSPQYFVVENNGNKDIKYRKSDRLEGQFSHDVKRVNLSAGIKMIDFSDPAMRQTDDAQFYNDFVAINEWTNEFWQSKAVFPLSLFLQPQMDVLNARYNADKLSLNMVVNYEYEKYKSPFYKIAFSLVLPPLAPVFLYQLFAHREETYSQNYLVNTHNATLLSKSDDRYAFADSRSLVKNTVYGNISMAENPDKPQGFLGNRLALSANMGIGVPALGYLFDHAGAEVDFHPGLNAEFVTAKKQSLSLYADYNATFFDINGVNDPQWLLNVSMLNTALSYRWYAARTAAPNGPYFGLGVMVSMVSVAPNELNFLNRMVDLDNYIDEKQFRYGLHLETGRNFMLTDRVFLNLFTRYTFTFANPFEPYFDVFTLSDEMGRTKALRSFNAGVWLSNLMVFGAGIGFLPF